jgi:hypothetical protein
MEDFDIPPDFFSQQGSGSLAAHSQQASQPAPADGGRRPSGLARDACQPALSAAHATSTAAGSAAEQLDAGAQVAAEEVPTRRGAPTDAAHLPQPSEGAGSHPAAAEQSHLAARLEACHDDAERQPPTVRAAAKPAISPVPMRLLEAVLPAIPELETSLQAAALPNEPEVHPGAAWCTAAASPAQAIGRIRAEGPTVMFDDGDGSDSPNPAVPGTPPGAVPSQQQLPPGPAAGCQAARGRGMVASPPTPSSPASASTALPPPTAGFQTAAGKAVAPAASAAAINQAVSFFDDQPPGPPLQPGPASTALPPPTAGFQTAAGKAVAPAASAAAMNKAVSVFDDTPAQQTGQAHHPPPSEEHRTPMLQRGRSNEAGPSVEQADAAAMQASNAAVQPAVSTFRSPMPGRQQATPGAAAQPAASRVLQQVSAQQAAAQVSATRASKKTFTPLRPLPGGSKSAADTPGARSAIQRAAAAKPAIGRRGGVRTPLGVGPRCAVRNMLLY